MSSRENMENGSCSYCQPSFSTFQQPYSQKVSLLFPSDQSSSSQSLRAHIHQYFHMLQAQNYWLQEIVQKRHLQVYLQVIKSRTIQFYLDLSEKLNFLIIFYQTEQKDERLQILNRIKDSASKIQLQLQQNEEIKKKSFIVAVKKMQTLKNIKSFENIGITCDILKGSEVGKELLKILEEKTLAKDRMSIPSISRIQQPTKDNLKQGKTTSKSAIVQQPRSQSLQQKIMKIKYSTNIPTSEKKTLKRQNDDQSNFTIKRSMTFDIDQLQLEQSPSKKRENHHISYYPTRTQKEVPRQAEYSHSITQNQQNVGMLDIATSEKSQEQNSYVLPEGGSYFGVLESIEQASSGRPFSKGQPSSPHILPRGTNISSINQQTIHPFKVNLSSLTNPLIISGQQSTTKILPVSLYNSQQGQLLLSSGNHKLISSSSVEQAKKQHLPNISSVQTEIMMEQFSEQSSIPNKLEVSITESEYSDMFSSQGEEEQPQLEIKVQAVVENQGSMKGLKPRLDICYIELYGNREIKFYSVYDKVTFSGKILKMYKSTDNFYDVVCEQQKTFQGQKQSLVKEQKIETIKKVKFRGQAKPFMKYLEKSQH